MKHKEITDAGDRQNETRRFVLWSEGQTYEAALAADSHTEVVFTDGCLSTAGPADWDVVVQVLDGNYGVREN